MALSFHDLQRELRPEWIAPAGGEGADLDVLVVPSLSMDRAQMALVTGAHHYEERQLFALVRLAAAYPRAVTAGPTAGAMGMQS